jgi:hypothetical protein
MLLVCPNCKASVEIKGRPHLLSCIKAIQHRYKMPCARFLPSAYLLWRLRRNLGRKQTSKTHFGATCWDGMTAYECIPSVLPKMAGPITVSKVKRLHWSEIDVPKIRYEKCCPHCGVK